MHRRTRFIWSAAAGGMAVVAVAATIDSTGPAAHQTPSAAAPEHVETSAQPGTAAATAPAPQESTPAVRTPPAGGVPTLQGRSGTPPALRPKPPGRARPITPRPVPVRPQGTRGGATTGRIAGPPSSPVETAVHPGESMWSITSRMLAATGRTPTAALVAVDWHAFYAGNTATIGADPDLIRPGQQLEWPAGL